MQNKKEKVQILADKLNSIIPLIDSFANSLTEEEYELFVESKEVLEEKINHGLSALPLIMACGGDYDDTEDRMKIKTLECLIELIKVRQQYKKEMVRIKEESEKKQEVLNIFRNMGMM